jgi:asparaginyl-tRNA synthetase
VYFEFIRRVQKLNTFLDVEDGLSRTRLQVVIPTEKLPENVSYHCAVSVNGTLVRSGHPAQEFELVADNLDLVSPVGNTTSSNEGQNDQSEYPFGPRKIYDEDFNRLFPMFRAKLNDFGCMLRVRHSLTHAIHDYFRKEEYIQIHTPILTSSDCEGAGEVFTVLPSSNSTIQIMKKEGVQDDNCAYFDRNVYLTVSGQLHLEAMCNGLAKVYTFNPAFRAEMGRSRRHLSEFSMIEAELAFVDNISSIVDIVQNLVRESVASVLKTNHEDIETYINFRTTRKKGQPKLDLSYLTKLVDTPFIVMTYKEALDVLELNAHKFRSKPRRGDSLGKEHEIFLSRDHCQNVPVFVINWPKSAKAFYARSIDEETVSALDLLLPEVGELCGGSLREHRPEVLEKRIQTDGLNFEALEWYIDLRKCGAAPTGGFGLGFERLVQFLLKINNIRDAVPFPRAPHSCRL